MSESPALESYDNFRDLETCREGFGSAMCQSVVGVVLVWAEWAVFSFTFRGQGHCRVLFPTIVHAHSHAKYLGLGFMPDSSPGLKNPLVSGTSRFSG